MHLFVIVDVFYFMYPSNHPPTMCLLAPLLYKWFLLLLFCPYIVMCSACVYLAIDVVSSCLKSIRWIQIMCLCDFGYGFPFVFVEYGLLFVIYVEIVEKQID
jgi:hypothetical protein